MLFGPARTARGELCRSAPVVWGEGRRPPISNGSVRIGERPDTTCMGEEQPGLPAPGDVVRFTALWDDYVGRVSAYACRHVDHHTAQEVVSETFMVAWRRLPEVRRRSEQGRHSFDGDSALDGEYGPAGDAARAPVDYSRSP